MTKTLSILAVVSLLFVLTACKIDTDNPKVIRGACVYLKEYLVVAKKTDHPETKRASVKQINFYKAHCKKAVK